MATKLPVIWTNGMNVSPIHFEQHTRFLEHLIYVKTLGISPNNYGILHLEISQELLNESKIGLNYISGISVDGSVFDAPKQDKLPDAIDLKNISINKGIIALNVPISQDKEISSSVENSISNTKYIFTNAIIKSNTYEENAMPSFDKTDKQELSIRQESINVSLGSLRLKLGIFGENLPNYTQIPICKIQEIGQNGKITLDPNFLPTSLNLLAFQPIRTYLSQSINSLHAHKSSISKEMKTTIKSNGLGDFVDILSIMILNKWYAIFSYISKKQILHPEYFYEKMLEFRADMLCLDSNQEEASITSYMHTDLTNTIMPLLEEARILFLRATAQKYIQANIISHGNGFYDCMFNNAEIIRDYEIIFAISASVDVQVILKDFLSQCKIYSKDKIRQLITSQLSGIVATILPSVPLEIPHLNNAVYYKINKQTDSFMVLKDQNTISFYVGSKFPQINIIMWAIPKK